MFLISATMKIKGFDWDRCSRKVAATLFAALAFSPAAFCQAQVQVTSLYPVDYHGAAGIPEVGDPWYGVAGNFTISGSGSAPYKIKVGCGAVVWEWDNVQLGPGQYWWWGAFNSSLEGPIPASFSIASSTSSSSMNASLPVTYPAHAIEFIDAKAMAASQTTTQQFQLNSGTIGKIEYMMGEPQLTSSQGPTISYFPPQGAIQLISQPLGIASQTVTWLNLNTAKNDSPTAISSFTTTLHDSRVNPSIMRSVPWSAITAPQPANVAIWQQSELFVPTNAPEITDIVTKALPANYQSTMTPWDAARAVFAQVVKHMTYNDTFSWNPLAAYDRGSGACGDFSYQFIVALRRIGFAAHVCAGWRTGASVWHVWSEFYMPGVGWVPADATDSNGIDPTGTYLYHFGTVPDLNTRTSVSLGGNSTWPGLGWNIAVLQVPAWYWSGGATYLSGETTSLLQTPTALSLLPSTSHAPSGGRMFAHVELQNPAGPNGVTVTLSSNSSAAQVPSTISIGAGGSSAVFPITVGTVSQDTLVTVSASTGTASQKATFTVHPMTVSVAFDSKCYAMNAVPQVTLTLSAQATAPTVVQLSSNASGWGLPASITIPTGSTSQAVAYPLPVGNLPALISVVAKLNNQTDSDTAYSVMRPIGIFFPTVAATGGTSVNLAVRLASPAPSGGMAVTLASNSSSLQFQSNSITVPAGKTTATMAANLLQVSANTLATVTATSSLGSVTTDLTILAQGPKRL